MLGTEFLITHKGYVGNTNGYIQKDDLVALVRGFYHPIIIRKDLSGKQYRFVGVADLPGITHPEEEIIAIIAKT
jgi:hypothetical protein